jgi:hypothetical protein
MNRRGREVRGPPWPAATDLRWLARGKSGGAVAGTRAQSIAFASPLVCRKDRAGEGFFVGNKYLGHLRFRVATTDIFYILVPYTTVYWAAGVYRAAIRDALTDR